MQILTKPGNLCTLEYILPSGRRSTARGLGNTYANDQGICYWAWVIGSKTKPGTGHLIVTVNNVNRQTYPIEIKP